MKVQGLLGVTLDDSDVFIVHINELYGPGRRQEGGKKEARSKKQARRRQVAKRQKGIGGKSTQGS
jgi:hypothetical protein